VPQDRSSHLSATGPKFVNAHVIAAQIELAADHHLRDLVLVRLGGVERAAIF
jgi:hypothetical protein